MSLTQPADAHRMPFETNLKAEHRGSEGTAGAASGTCEPIGPQHLFSKRFSSREILRINRSCGICARAPSGAGESAWCRGDEFGTNRRLPVVRLWTDHSRTHHCTIHPQLYRLIHMVIHRCESTIQVPKNRFVRCPKPGPIGIGPGSIPLESYRLDRCLMRAVSSCTWS